MNFINQQIINLKVLSFCTSFNPLLHQDMQICLNGFSIVIEHEQQNDTVVIPLQVARDTIAWHSMAYGTFVPKRIDTRIGNEAS